MKKEWKSGRNTHMTVHRLIHRRKDSAYLVYHVFALRDIESEWVWKSLRQRVVWLLILISSGNS